MPSGVSSITQWPCWSAHSVRHFSYTSTGLEPRASKICPSAGLASTSVSVFTRFLCGPSSVRPLGTLLCVTTHLFPYWRRRKICRELRSSRSGLSCRVLRSSVRAVMRVNSSAASFCSRAARSATRIFTSVSIACIGRSLYQPAQHGKMTQVRVTLKKTLRLAVDPNAIDSRASMCSLQQAAELLRSGGTVAFPTETGYGLGANALDQKAVRSIFDAKQRPAWDPLILLVVDQEQLAMVAVDIPSNGRMLMKAFWPGPLTLLLPRSPQVPVIVTAGRDRVGVRMPSHPVAQKLIELANVPIAAPSANSFGRTSPTRAEFVLQDLDGRIDAVIDSGDTTLGLESIVVDICADPPILYRPGMVTLQQLQALCPSLVAYRESEVGTPAAQPSPGVGLKHYSPRARLVL